MTQTYRTKILGTGAYLPQKVLTNHDLAKMVDTSDEWIVERTGIKERRIAQAELGEFASMMGAEAAKKAIEMAGIDKNTIDFILVSTGTPDHRFPNCASIIQKKIGINNECPCLDVSAACTGYVYALSMADSMIKSGNFKNILVIGTEMLTPYINFEDRTSCILFADGAGATLVSRAEEKDNCQILSTKLACDSIGAQTIHCPAGNRINANHELDLPNIGEYVQMEGRQVFKYATRTLTQNLVEVIEQAGLNSDTLDWVIPHQANLRIIEYISNKISYPMEKIIVTIEKYGNNSSATIPIALDEAVRSGKLKRGQTFAIDAFGAGVTSGAMVVRY